MHNNSEEITIPLLSKNLKIIQKSDYFNFSIDSLLISEFINIKKKARNIVDLGTGNGAIPLFLSKKTDSKIYGIELQNESYNLAVKNIIINNLNEQIYLINDNMKNYYKYFKNGSIDIVVSNPPFFKVNPDKKFLNNLKQLTIARHELEINLEELVTVAHNLLKDKGYFYLVHRVDRFSEIFLTLKKYSFEIKKIRFCYTTAKKDAKIILIEAIKNGSSGLKVLQPLIINDENGNYTEEVLKMFE